jgi:hypothetical protein
MKTIKFKDSYNFTIYLFENKLITVFSKENTGFGCSVSNDIKLQYEKTQ